MKKILLLASLIVTPVFAQQMPSPTNDRSNELISTDLGKMHLQIINLVAQLETSQKSLGEATAKLKELEAKLPKEEKK